MPEFDINTIQHPFYTRRYEDWYKWRITFEGGQRFLQTYLWKYTNSEEDEDFIVRKRISYCAAFAKAALIEVRNSIYQRMTDITREGGSKVYQQAVIGKNAGVDLLGSSMNVFMGTEVLDELLTMSKVGIYIDMPPRQGDTLADNKHIRPYLYVYNAEDIRSWDLDDNPTPNQFRSLLLRDYVYESDDTTLLPTGEKTRYRYFWIEDGRVFVEFYNDSSEKIDPNTGQPDSSSGPIELNVSKIPFIVLDLGESLLTDIADYQVALTNLASADMAYAIGANFPFYVEQFDPRMSSVHFKRPTADEDTGQAISGENAAKSENVQVGAARGRRYPLGTDAPSFIHPSAEPMKASMEKQEQLKREIRLLINLAITNIQPKMASAESKGFDERTLESGLSYIGLILEDAERQIAEIWAMYEGSNSVATIHYPQKYNLKSDDERRKDVKELKDLIGVVPSITYKREVAKKIVRIMFGTSVSSETLAKMEAEIDKAEIITADSATINKDVEDGILATQDAAKARCYPTSTVDKANENHLERLKRIQAAQTPRTPNPAARGIQDLSPDPTLEAKTEKQVVNGTVSK